jgi:ABC-type phosphate transport system permease subunit
MSPIRFREFAADAGWLVIIVLLLPVIIPLGVLAAVFLVQERLYGEGRRRMRARRIKERAGEA